MTFSIITVPVDSVEHYSAQHSSTGVVSLLVQVQSHSAVFELHFDVV